MTVMKPLMFKQFHWKESFMQPTLIYFADACLTSVSFEVRSEVFFKV